MRLQQTRVTRVVVALVMLSLVLSFVGSTARAATFSNVGNVSRDPGLSIQPRTAQDPDGNVHVVWDEEGARQVLYAKGVWNGTEYVFGTPYQIASVGSFGYATPNVIVAPNGTLMVSWTQRAGDTEVGYVQAWNSRAAQPGGSPIPLGIGIQSSLAVDSASRFHLAWNGQFQIQYCQWDGGGGCTKRDAFGGGGSTNNLPDLAVDSSDNVHVVWYGAGNVVLYRARPANGEWGNVEQIDGGNLAQIAADREGNVHLAWSRDFNIQYCRKTLTTGCTDVRTFDFGSDVRPTIAADPSNNVLLVFQDLQARQLVYAARENGQWSAPQNFANGPTYPDVTARPYTNRFSVVWSRDYDIQLLTVSPGAPVAPPPPAAPAPPAPPAPQVPSRVFPETGQTVSGRLLDYWDRNGALPVFGFPLNAEGERRTLDGTYRMQLFERNRLELHPENAAPYDVLLGRLGGDVLYQQGRPWETLPREQPRAGCKYFPETQHNLCEPFLGYWRSHGLELGDPGISERESLALFGLPLTSTNFETNGDGWRGETQWFERARFELHTENQPPYRILLGRLGAEVR